MYCVGIGCLVVCKITASRTLKRMWSCFENLRIFHIGGMTHQSPRKAASPPGGGLLPGVYHIHVISAHVPPGCGNPRETELGLLGCRSLVKPQGLWAAYLTVPPLRPRRACGAWHAAHLCSSLYGSEIGARDLRTILNEAFSKRKCFPGASRMLRGSLRDAGLGVGVRVGIGPGTQQMGRRGLWL